MPKTFDGPRLKSFVAGFVRESGRLAQSVKYARNRFYQREIAEVVFQDSTVKDPAAGFSAMLQAGAKHRLQLHHVQQAIEGCREWLAVQLGGGGDRHASESVRVFEKKLCGELRLGANGFASAEDFLLDRLLDGPLDPSDFGLPDLIKWRPTNDFVLHLPTNQANSIPTLHNAAAHIARVGDRERKLKLLYVVLCAATANHPGSPNHETAVELAYGAADAAGLGSFVHGRGVPDESRYLAAWLQSQLHWLHFIPTQYSTFNCLTHALRGTRIPSSQWREALSHVARAVELTRLRVQLKPGDDLATRKLASALSMHARLMISGGDSTYEVEATALYDEASVLLNKIINPYGLVFPVMRHLHKGQVMQAASDCERAIEICESNGHEESANAFSALLVNLTSLKGAGALADMQIRRRARAAVSTPSTAYQFSHVFDAAAARRVLSGRRTASAEYFLRAATPDRSPALSRSVPGATFGPGRVLDEFKHGHPARDR